MNFLGGGGCFSFLVKLLKGCAVVYDLSKGAKYLRMQYTFNQASIGWCTLDGGARLFRELRKHLAGVRFLSILLALLPGFQPYEDHSIFCLIYQRRYPMCSEHLISQLASKIYHGNSFRFNTEYLLSKSWRPPANSSS
jgi:hypothetical protein